jgi:chemotaxis protein MotB
LSAARAASVVHQFTKQGIDPLRLEIVGFGEFHPRRANDTVEGRNANRRVAVLVLEDVTPAGGARPGAATTTATASNSKNGVVSSAPAGEVDKTVLVTNPTRAPPAPSGHIGPAELIWPGAAASEAKAPAPKHE